MPPKANVSVLRPQLRALSRPELRHGGKARPVSRVRASENSTSGAGMSRNKSGNTSDVATLGSKANERRASGNALANITNTVTGQPPSRQPIEVATDGAEAAALSETAVAEPIALLVAAAVMQAPVVLTAPVQVEESADRAQEYAIDITEHLFREQAATAANASYIETQPDINPKMRTILVDWLVEVHWKHQLRSDTLHLTLNLIDRYLTRKPVERRKLQLVGVVAMLVAAKFEEITPPDIEFCIYISANAYSRQDVLSMECMMLTTLDFKIVVPTVAHFLPLFLEANQCEEVHSWLVQYIIELGLLDIRMIQYTPSHRVAAAVLLSNALLSRRDAWPQTMVQVSGLSASALRDCVEVLQEVLEADHAGLEGWPKAIRKKFSSTRCQEVALMTF
jgi:cyclin B